MVRWSGKSAMLSMAGLPALSAWLAFAAFCERAGAQTAPPGDEVRVGIEQLARSTHYFSCTVVVVNRSLGIVSADAMTRSTLALQQDELAKNLRQLSYNREALAGLLHHADAHVRTLALGALFEREDGRDLPLIAALTDDPAATYPDLHESASQMGGPRPMIELESPQTVGQIAATMLRFWTGPPLASSAVATASFAEYWQRYAGRDHSASWFAVKMTRATGSSFPSGTLERPAIQSVLYQIERLPSPEREWTLLYVLSPEASGSNPELQREQAIVPDEELLAAAKRIPRASILRFLRRERISDDPDFNLPELNSAGTDRFTRIADFLLLHANRVLERRDAGALLAQEKVERAMAESKRQGVDPSWAIGRAQLDPANAIEILKTEIADEPLRYDGAIGELAGAMWQIRGPAALGYLTNWFYTTPPRRPGGAWEQPVVFLEVVQHADRPETKQLIAALIHDPRFDRTTQTELRELLTLVNAGRTSPFIERNDLYRYLQPGPEEQAMLVGWRKLLRHEYEYGVR